MEIPSLSKQCAESSCKQLDFLPLHCKCGLIFCTEHFNVHTQSCEISKYVSESELKTIEDVYVCSHKDCKERSIVPLICERCKNHFCIKHRHLSECEEKNEEQLQKEREKYTEPVQRFNLAKAIVDEQVENKLADAKKKLKNRETAAKIQLMKIKGKATGLKSIPTSNRVYFNVTHTSNQSEKILPVFVSNRWTVGRSIDAIAEEHKLENNNNKSAAKKLRLFRKDDNRIIANSVSSVVNDLLKDNLLVNGENLVIEYVDDDCVSL